MTKVRMSAAAHIGTMAESAIALDNTKQVIMLNLAHWFAGHFYEWSVHRAPTMGPLRRDLLGGVICNAHSIDNGSGIDVQSRKQFNSHEQ